MKQIWSHVAELKAMQQMHAELGINSSNAPSDDDAGDDDGGSDDSGSGRAAAAAQRWAEDSGIGGEGGGYSTSELDNLLFTTSIRAEQLREEMDDLMSEGKARGAHCVRPVRVCANHRGLRDPGRSGVCGHAHIAMPPSHTAV